MYSPVLETMRDEGYASHHCLMVDCGTQGQLQGACLRTLSELLLLDDFEHE